MAKIAKKLFFDIPGMGRVHAMPGGTFNPGGHNREGVVADTGVVGFTEEPVAPTAEFTLPNTANVDLNQLRNLVDVNVNIQDDNGKSWVMREAWVVEPTALTNGEISVSMSGVAADPVG